MDYRYFTLEEFVADDRFRRWVKQPDAASVLFWRTFLVNYPEQRRTVQLAVEAVGLLAEATEALAEPVQLNEKEAIWQQVRAHILATTPPCSSPFLTVYRTHIRRGLVAAACVVATLGAGWWWLPSRSLPVAMSAAAVVRSASARGGVPTQHRVNNSRKPLLITLSDGSSVMLQPNSRLHYPSQFTGSRRVVQLTGEAFFEVAKNPGKPFFVYTNELVTKVLGTSFSIRAYTRDKQVVVTVRSGKVAVFASPAGQQASATRSAELAGVVLTRNQQLVFARPSLHLSSPTDPTPLPLKATTVPGQTRFQFDATPVSEVFAQLEHAYGLTISYDRATLGKCRLTADLTDEPLLNKLLIICKSIEATYTLSDNRLTVSGPGCGA